MMYVLRMSVTPETQPPPVDVHEQRFLLPGEVLPGNGVDPLPLLSIPGLVTPVSGPSETSIPGNRKP